MILLRDDELHSWKLPGIQMRRREVGRWGGGEVEVGRWEREKGGKEKGREEQRGYHLVLFDKLS